MPPPVLQIWSTPGLSTLLTSHQSLATRFYQHARIIEYVSGILSLGTYGSLAGRLYTAMISIVTSHVSEQSGIRRFHSLPMCRGFPLNTHAMPQLSLNMYTFLLQDRTENLFVIGRYISDDFDGVALHPIDFMDASTGQLVAEVKDHNITTICPVNKLHPRLDVMATGSSR